MAEYKVSSRVDQGHTKIRNVPIAVTPEGFWCCPSPVMFQKAIKAHNAQHKTGGSSPPPKTSIQKKPVTVNERNPATTSSRSRVVSEEQNSVSSDAANVTTTSSVVPERSPKPENENLRKKVSIEFGEHGTSDLKVVLCGKQGFSVKMSVHRNVLVENSSFFANKLSNQESPSSCVQVTDCDDVECYVETVGLMYCKDMRQRLIKQSVPRVLRVLKISELIGFRRCIQSCLEYLEAVPWVGEEEEEKVVSSVLRVRTDTIGVSPILKRVSSEVTYPPSDTLTHIMDLVLKSNEERGRREMKSLVLRLLKENKNPLSNGSFSDVFNQNTYKACQDSLDSLLIAFKDHIVKQIALEADNLLWLLEILSDRQAADEFAVLWATQKELAALHAKLPTSSRHLVSCITARFFVGIGRGEILPSKDTRHLLLDTWLQPLIDDYYWLQHSCRSFDRKLVEEGIGRTILTLPLEDQQNILLAWLGSFLKAGDNCPNLHRAFEVWWRRTFVRPHVEQQQRSVVQLDSGLTTPN
ncbi:hypothetical protein ACHQM5_023274 [Ranunculus cassubicifolius]